jgi:hypothetical protein
MAEKVERFRSKNTVVFIYHSFKDPLFQNLVFQYIKTLASSGPYKFYLITYEQERFKVSKPEQTEIKQELAKLGVYWYPLTYHTGKFLLIKKLYDFLAALFLIAQLKFTKRLKLIFAFTNLSASISIICAKVLNLKSLIYCYEPHTDYLVELGDWQRSSIKYKLSNYIEKYAGREADYVLASTKYVVEELKKWNAKGKVYRAPVSIDESDFYFRPDGRMKIRNKYKINDRKVFLYIGKFGGLYYKREVALLCYAVKQHIHDAFFLIVTSNPYTEVYQWFVEEGLSEEDFAITSNLSNEEVKEYISAADIGLSIVPPSPSQRYRSPTKVAEYLMCGLPYITCKGVSEDDIYAEQYNVGIVLLEFSREEVERSITKLKSLMEEKRSEQQARCREIGVEYRSKRKIDKYLEEIYAELK